MWYLDVLFETPGVGGAVAGVAIVIFVACYGLTVRWIVKGDEGDTEG